VQVNAIDDTTQQSDDAYMEYEPANDDNETVECAGEDIV
jgi:hypothetical protein